MKTDLETMIGYLAGRAGGDAARLRAEFGDPSSEASRFLEAARRRTRALVDDRPAEEPRPAPAPRRARAWRISPAAAAAALVLVSALVPLGVGEVRERRLRAALDRAEADSRAQAGRLRAALLARPTPTRPDPPASSKPRDEPITLALNRVEEGLGKLERRLDGFSRPAPGPPTAIEVPPPIGPDPSLGEIRAEIVAIRRETASSEQATARQLQEMRTVLQELNQIVRRAVSRPQGGPQQVPMPMMMPGNEPNLQFGPNQSAIDPVHVQALIQNLSSPHPHVRLEAAERLARFGPAASHAASDLRQMLHHEPDARVRTAAQAALTHLKPE